MLPLLHYLCGSRECPFSPLNGKFIGGGGILKTKLLDEKYKAKLEFTGGGEGTRGCQAKNLLWGECGYFLELHITFTFINNNTC